MPESPDPITSAPSADAAPEPAAPLPKPDPGTRRSHAIAIAASIVFFLIVATLQGTPSQDPNSDAEPNVGIEAIDQQVDIALRLTIKMSHAPVVGEQLRSDPETLRVLESWSKSPLERVYVAIAAAELSGPDAAIERLEQAFEQADAEQLKEDIRVLEGIYRAAIDGAASEIDPAEREGLEDRHGYFARVALTYPLAESDAARAALRGGAWGIGVMVLGVIAMIGAVLLGFGLFAVAIVLLATGRIRRRAPRPVAGGSVFLETFAVFVGGFMCIKLAHLLAERFVPEDRLGPISLALMGAQWLLLLTPLWPMVRGMRFADWRQAIGLHTGCGLLREMGCGVVAYLAALPLYVGAIVLTVLLLVIREAVTGGPVEAPSNPIVDLVSRADPVMLVLFFLMATVWAPLCEEMIFRGAVYRHLRAYTPAVVAGLISSVLFAFMHNYGPMLTPPLMALGFAFCMMREWRGSLVASMTAHAMHNGALLIVLFSLIRALG